MKKDWKKHTVRCHDCLGEIQTYSNGAREVGDIARCMDCEKVGMVAFDDADNEYIYWGTIENGF